jgi:uncharacterized membrane protein (UPF0127 family)
MKAFHATTHKEIAGNLEVAETFRARSKGLLGKSSLMAGEGLLIRPCKAVHTIGMKFPIDVVFLDHRNQVIAFCMELRPNRLTSIRLRAASVLELPAGTVKATTLKLGDEVELVQATDKPR